MNGAADDVAEVEPAARVSGRPRPGLASVTWLLLLALLGAVTTAAAYLLLRRAAPVGGEPTAAVAGVAAAKAVPRPSGRSGAWHKVTVEPTTIALTDFASMHEWVVSVRDPAGAPLTGCLVSFDASMPEHGHGLPTAPRVTGESKPGDYVVEGVRFSMPGHWELTVSVSKCGPAVRSVFDLRI
jgi:hypothetical protein